MNRVLEHLHLVVWSTLAATLISVPLGLLCSHRPKLASAVGALVGALQVIPSLALFALLLPLPFVGGIGNSTAIVALIFYALLPIVRGTLTGVSGIDPSLQKAAAVLGMTTWQRVRFVELPLALPVIATGLRVAIVTGVGVATIGAAIGAGGLGSLIFRGLRANDSKLLFEGAALAAGLALSLDALVAWFARRLRERRSVALFGLLPLALLLLGVAQRLQNQASEQLPALSDGTGPVAAKRPIVVCSKDFAEQVLLSESLALALEAHHEAVVRRFELGGNLCHQALVAGEVDIYPEYTGTALLTLLHESLVPPAKAAVGPAAGTTSMTEAQEVFERVVKLYAKRYSVDVSPPIGFANDFVILVRQDIGDSVQTISDLAPLSRRLRAGFGQEFLSRADGYKGLSQAYGLGFAHPREMDLALTYDALAAHQLDVIAGNSTDGLIASLNLKVLRDDRHYFPPYQAVWLSRRSVRERVQAAIAEVHFSDAEMRAANLRALHSNRPRAP